ncbi:hypothetical protein, partial [Maridesulfovibrio ferrireducens]|uniref:hypothetical protein n=1 Tax=Maridesulfovibrio ferrireducens TaxID=246191 RepID=UPI0026F2E53C
MSDTRGIKINQIMQAWPNATICGTVYKTEYVALQPEVERHFESNRPDGCTLQRGLNMLYCFVFWHF